MRSRATTSAGMAPSMIAIVRVTVLDSRPRSVIIMRAIARADGALRGRAAPVAVRSSLRRLHPFGDHAKRTGKACQLGPPPQRGTVPAASCPVLIKLFQEWIQ